MTLLYQTIDDLEESLRLSLSEEEALTFLTTANIVFSQTKDRQKADLAGMGMIRRLRRGLPPTVSVRSAPNGNPIIGGWGLQFTTPETPGGVDGLFFSTMSHLLTEFYKDAPLWMEHGMDADYGWEPIGRRHSVLIYGFGIWAEHELFRRHRLFARTWQDLLTGVLSYSSDSIAHYVEAGFLGSTGEFRVWPLAGWSLTRSPAEPGLGLVTPMDLETITRDLTSSPVRRVRRGPATLTLSAARSIRSFTHLQGVTRMDPQMLADLAAFLGVDPTVEAVLAALQELISRLETPAEPAEGAEAAPPPPTQSELSALQAALGLQTQSITDLVSALRSFVPVLQADADDPDDEDTEPIDVESPLANRDFAALRSAFTALGRHQTPPAPGTRSSGPTARRHAPMQNRGAQRPTIHDAIQIAMGIRPSKFSTVSMAQARRSVFSPDEPRRAARASNFSFSDGPRGAYVLNREIASDILEPLVDEEVVMAAGATTYPMDGIETLTINKQTTTPESYWIGEKQAVEESDVEWGQMQLSLKTLACAVRFPNRWMRTAMAGVEKKVRTSMIGSINRKLDWTFLYGNGGRPAGSGHSGTQPLGLLYTTGVTVASSVGGAPGLGLLKAAEKSLIRQNVPKTNTWQWIANPALFLEYQYMVDQNGQPILREGWEGGPASTLVKYPYLETNAISVIEGTGNNETRLFFGDWSQFAVGYGMDIEIFVSEHRYAETMETLVIAFVDVDCAVLRPEAFHVTPGIILP